MNLNFNDIAKTIANMMGGSKDAPKNLEDLTKGFKEILKTASAAAQEELTKEIDKVKDEEKAEAKTEAKAETFSINGHNYTVRKDEDAVLVSFTNIPSDAEELKQVYRNLLGKSEYTVPALIPMAMEIYARDRQEGEKCFAAFCSSLAVSEILRILKEKFGRPNDSYCQRYLPAALLQGASNMNAYTPNTPYTVRIEHAANADTESAMYNGKYFFLVIIADGWDTRQRGVQVLKTYDNDFYVVNGCPPPIPCASLSAANGQGWCDIKGPHRLVRALFFYFIFYSLTFTFLPE